MKKIQRVRCRLVDALEKHAALVSEKPMRHARIQSAAAEVRSAAMDYQTTAAAITSYESPFAGLLDLRLDPPTLASLASERDAFVLRLSSKRATESECK